jgi:hypothetical protein
MALLTGLPEETAKALEPLERALPLSEAMPSLTAEQPASEDVRQAAEAAMSAEPIASRPSLQAAILLYIDELEASHRISQGIDNATGAFLHGIMHRREGDFSNSHYWFRRVGSHPAFERIRGYDPHALIDEAALVHRRREPAPARLLELQRQEWAELFAWCVEHPEVDAAG